MDIVEAIHSEKLLRPAFRDLSTWSSWLVLLKAFFGLKMDKADVELFTGCTGRKKAPGGEFQELWCISGRRSGKSFMAAVIAVYLALFFKYDEYLAPGEHGVVMLISADRAQSQTLLRYIKGLLHSNPVFGQYVDEMLKESLQLTNSIRIEVMSASFRSIRGRSVVAAVFDEIAFWRTADSAANPDHEILSACRPSMATIPNSKLIVISSPYARYGTLYEHFRDYYGVDESKDILVWQSRTRLMNPTISQDLIDRESKKDPSASRAEWEAEFRADIETFLSPDALERCIRPAGNLAPVPFTNYLAFCDPSGGRSDAMTLAIAHLENERCVVDLIKAWTPPFDPASVVGEISDLCSPYKINSITGDRYAGVWVENTFKRFGIAYRTAEKAKSDLYLNFEARVNTGQVELPDDEQLVRELLALERRRGRSGKDFVDHPPRGHDDRANAVAGVVYECFENTGLIFPELRRVAADG
jgi:hypothetical protein